MGIERTVRICTVQYINGNTANLTLKEIDGMRVVDNVSVVDALLAPKLLKNNQLIEIPVGERPASGSSVVNHFAYITFSGKKDNGQNLPRIEIRFSQWYDQIGIRIKPEDDDSSLMQSRSDSGFLYNYWEVSTRPYPTKMYFGIGKDINDSNKYHIFVGIKTGGDYIESYEWADGYFTRALTTTYNPTIGTIEDPEKFESKPNDASEATLDDTSDIIVIDSLPSAVYAGGLFRIYELSNTQMTTLSNELTDPNIIEALVRTVTSPLDYVVSLKAMPVTFEGFSTSLRLGNYTSADVGSVKQINSFLFDIDCGSVTIPKYFDSFLDWSPYTNATLYLPFVGYVSLNLDKFIGDSVSIKYRVDVVSGDCIAFVSNTTGLIATYSGNCAYNLPLRANDASAIVAGLYSALSGLTTGNGGQFAQGAFQLTEGVYKPNMVSTSGLSANAGSMCNRKPYLIVERPRVSLPKTYPQNIGYMCRISAKLSDIHGYTEVEAIHLDNVIATREEKAELEALLRNGVVLP